jgi:hypothetical protein
VALQAVLAVYPHWSAAWKIDPVTG